MAIIEGIKVSGYIRRKPRSEKPDPILMDLLATDLPVKLSEPLDSVDMADDWKQKQREIW